MKDELYKLLDVYTLEEILDALDLEPVDILVMLEEQGLLAELNLPKPL